MFTKKIFLTISLLLLINITRAEICPTPSEIKGNILKDWSAFGLDSGEPISDKEMEEFKNSVQHFKAAHWLEDAPEGPAQCYYSGKEPYLNAYLAKFNKGPDLSIGNWHTTSYDDMQCDSSIDVCRFYSN